MTITFKVEFGDVPFNSATGRPFTVETTEKLRQDVRENLDTVAQSDGTGADLDGVVGLVGDIFAIRAELSRRLNDSFDSLRKVQELIQRSDRTLEERFSRMTQLVVMPLREPSTGQFFKTSYAYRVDVSSAKSQKPVSATGILSR